MPDKIAIAALPAAPFTCPRCGARARMLFRTDCRGNDFAPPLCGSCIESLPRSPGLSNSVTEMLLDRVTVREEQW